MSNDNIFNKDYRRKFISRADSNRLNDYLKNLEKLSIKKGGKYTEIYNDDLNFLMDMMDEMEKKDVISQSGGHLLNMFVGINIKPSKKLNSKNNVEESEMQDTETYISRINKITSPNNIPKYNPTNEKSKK